MRTYTVGYIIGSLSKESINRTLSKALIRLVSPQLTFTEIPICRCTVGTTMSTTRRRAGHSRRPSPPSTQFFS